MQELGSLRAPVHGEGMSNTFAVSRYGGGSRSSGLIDTLPVLSSRLSGARSARTSLPPAPGKPARREHEYTRNRWDLIRFLDHLDDEIPVVDGQKIIAVTDNLSTRGTDEVEQSGSRTIRGGAFSSHRSTRRG